jgi:hypothetical protein
VLRASTRDSDLIAPLADRRLSRSSRTRRPTSRRSSRDACSRRRAKLRFERDGRTLGVSLSVGVAHNQHDGSLSFDTLVSVAEEGLAVADAAGGDRFVETELYQLYERRRRMEADQKERALLFGEPGPNRAPGARAGDAPRRGGSSRRSPRSRKEERLRSLLADEGFAGIDLQGSTSTRSSPRSRAFAEAETVRRRGRTSPPRASGSTSSSGGSRSLRTSSESRRRSCSEWRR